MMKKKALSLILCFVMLLSLLPATVFAGEPTTPTATKRIALASPSDAIMSKGNHTNGATVVYYGGKPWVLLTMRYDSNNDGTIDGPLLLSEFVYNYNTQWMAYSTGSDSSGNDKSKGYLASDIRGYINGANYPAESGGHGINTFTAFRLSLYYGEAATAANCSHYWERVTVTETTPTENTVYFVKDSNSTYSDRGRRFTENEFDAVKGGNELYTRSGESPDYTYTPVQEWTADTTYYYDTTPYVAANVSGGFLPETTYYTFQKPKSYLKVNNVGASSSVSEAYYYAGYSVTDLDASTTDESRTILAGMNTGSKTFAVDLRLGEADLAALNPVTAAGCNWNNTYKILTGANSSDYHLYYGDALDGDKLFLLSAKEVSEFLPSVTQRVAKYGSTEEEAHWWLRSSCTGQLYSVGLVKTNGIFGYGYARNDKMGVRPAFNLNLNSVIFTSSASEESGKALASVGSGNASFVPLAKSTDTSSYKLTLKDETFGVDAKLLKGNGDGTCTVTYENAKLAEGKNNVYVSAIITDDTGENVYGYTKLASVTKNDQSGTATFILPDGITLGDDYVLKVFEEQCNDWNQNDYASVPQTIEPTYTITVNNLPATATSITYKLGSGEEKTVPVTSGKAVISAPAQSNYSLTVKDSNDVTYVGSANLTGSIAKTVNCVSTPSAISTDELLQQAPVMTMTPDMNSTDVSVSQKSVIVTVDQDTSIVGNKALMYVYSTDGNRENDLYTAVYEQTITADMYDEKTRALELKLASFRSGSSYLTTLTSGYSYKLVLNEGTVKSVNGVSQLGNKEFSAYFKPTAYLGFTVQLLKPLNGNVYAYRTGNTSVTTGTGSLTAALGDTVTIYARPDVGYMFDSYSYKWNGVEKKQEELVNSNILTVDPDDSSIVHVVADTDAAATLRVVANFKLDTGITDYTVTQYKTSYSVCVGSNVTLSYVVTPGGAALAFESSNNDVAVANGSAVYGMKVGTATITAKDPYDKVVGTWTITVVPAQTDRPQITTNAASNITNTGATLSGTYSGKGFTAREVGIALRTVGGSTQYFKMNSIPADGKVSVDVSGLTPGATYYYSVYVTTANGTTYTDSVYGYEAAANKFTTLSGESNSVIWKSLQSVLEKAVNLLYVSHKRTTYLNVFRFLFRILFD